MDVKLLKESLKMEISKQLNESYRLEQIMGEHFVIFKHEDGGQDFVSVNTLKNLDTPHHKDMRDWLFKNHPEVLL